MHTRSASETDQQYRALRPRLLMCMVIGYAAFYLTRKCSAAIFFAPKRDKFCTARRCQKDTFCTVQK